ncbi:MAG: hypothetical protein VX681_00315 [Myxococcota bacterium]|nr:hypothetical protein [Myxococcota bacterium]
MGVDAVSGRLAGLATLPEVDLAGAAQLAPDIVVLAALPAVDDPVAQPLVALGAALVEFAPEDLEDISALYKGLGVQLVGSVAALRAEAEMLRRLARIGGSSFGQRRPRTLAIVGLDPFLLAGAHSFETDLIEIAGGNSVTHTDGGEEFRIESSPARLDGYAPELLLVLTPEPLSSEQRRALLEMLGDRYPVEFLAVDGQTFWLEDPPAAAQRLREVIERVSRALAVEASWRLSQVICRASLRARDARSAVRRRRRVIVRSVGRRE